MGYPRFKSKKKGLGSFRLTGTIIVFPDAIQLPRLGRLRLKERGYLPTAGVKVLSATVAEQAGHWYVSVQVEQEQTVPVNDGPIVGIVGVDLGVKHLATLSDGTVIPNPKPLKRRQRTIKRLQRAVARKQKGSQNRKKAARKLGTEHRKVAHQRADTLHQLTSRLAKTKAVVVIEDSTCRDAEEPPPGASHRGCGIWRVPPAVGIQGDVVRVPGGGGRPLVRVVQDVFGVRLER